jgi:hypothetical protein
MSRSKDYTSDYYNEFDLKKYRELFGAEKNSENGKHWNEAEKYILENIDSGYYFEIIYERTE